MFRWFGVASVLLMTVTSAFAGDNAAPADSPGVVPVEGADVKGRPQQDLVNVKTARYFIWYDSQGWHLRTAARALTQYSGSIKLENGSFIKLRPIGLDLKAKNPDRWGVNNDRSEIRFVLHTVRGFDGFDFDVRRSGGDSKVVFDLKQGKNGQTRPKRIFLGRESKNPSSACFECPANPAANKPANEDG